MTQQLHLHGGDSEGDSARVSSTDFKELEKRVVKLEKWVWFVSGATGAIGYLIGASGVIHKLFQ